MNVNIAAPRIVESSCGDMRDGVQRWWNEKYTIRITDGGRSFSKRPRSKNDCTVIAFALVCDVSYDDAYDVLWTHGREPHKGFHFRELSSDNFEYARLHNVIRFVWEPYPAKRGEYRMHVGTFVESHPTGRYILRVSKHVVACIDGEIYDQSDIEPFRCVYGAWKVEVDRS